MRPQRRERTPRNNVSVERDYGPHYARVVQDEIDRLGLLDRVQPDLRDLDLEGVEPRRGVGRRRGRQRDAVRRQELTDRVAARGDVSVVSKRRLGAGGQRT